MKLSGKWLCGPALRLFGTTRIPQLHCDALHGLTGEKSCWIHVMFREWSYRVLAYNKFGARVSPATLEHSLAAVVSDVRDREAAQESCLPVGRLTADHRDTWAHVRPEIPEFQASLLTSLFVLESGTSPVLVTHKCDEYESIGILSLYALPGRLHLLYHE